MGKFFKSNIFKGTCILTIFAFLSKALGAVFKIGLSFIVGSHGMGIYQLIFPLFVFFIVLSSEGFSVALTIKTAENKDHLKQKSYFNFSLGCCLFISICSTIFIVVFSRDLSLLQGGRVQPYLYLTIAIGIIVVSVLSVFKAYIRGLENYKLYSVSEIIEDVFKVVFGLIFGYLLMPYGVSVAVAGVVLGIVVSSVLTLIVLLIFTTKTRKVKTVGLNRNEKNNYLKYSFLLMGSAVIIPAVHFVESTLIIDLLLKSGATLLSATKLYGLSRGSVSALINLPFFLLSSIEVLLLPNLSRSKTQGVYYKKTSLSLLLAIFVSFPFVLLFVLFPSQIVELLYGKAFLIEELEVASNLLRIGAVGIVFSSISTILTVIMNANNKVGAPFFASILAGLVKIIFLIIFVPKLSIYGAELSSVLFSMVFCLVTVIFAVKYKIFKSPKLVLFVILGWSLIFCFVYFMFNQLKNIFSNSIVACICAFSSVGIILVITLFIFYLINRKKFANFIKWVAEF